MFSDTEFIAKGVMKKEKLITDFEIKAPLKRNRFSLRKKWPFEKLTDDTYMAEWYDSAKRVFKIGIRNYSVKNQDKPGNSLFKNRSFDKDFLKHTISKFIEAKEK